MADTTTATMLFSVDNVWIHIAGIQYANQIVSITTSEMLITGTCMRKYDQLWRRLREKDDYIQLAIKESGKC